MATDVSKVHRSVLQKSMDIAIRVARQEDKDEIVPFCTHTFSWGDYIAEVWDIWFREKNGALLVAESGGESIGIGHVSLCPSKQGVWLEGVRVRPDSRRSGVASKLLDAMLAYGIRTGAPEALAVVSLENEASRRMLEKCGFESITEWCYFSGGQEIKKPEIASSARIAAQDDMRNVCSYLDCSELFEKSAGRYVKSWRWYRLDHRSVNYFIRRQRVIVTGDPINGIGVINIDGYWNRKNIIQVVYLDSCSADSVNSILTFVTNLCHHGNFERLHVLCHYALKNRLRKLNIKESERFLVYRKELLAAR